MARAEYDSNKFVRSPGLAEPEYVSLLFVQSLSQSTDEKPHRPMVRNFTATDFLIDTPLAG
jgi:hypothetical protein